MTKNLPKLLPNHATYGSHDRRDETITGKQVVIGAGSVCDRFIDCTFLDCEIRIQCAGRMTGVALASSKFLNCTIWPGEIQKITNFKACFESCTFKGTYAIEFHGELKHCSFAAAKVNRALFFRQTNLSLQTVPSWPHIVIDNLDINRVDFMQTVSKDSLLGIAAWKRPHMILANLETECENLQTTWDLLRTKEYVWTREAVV